MGVIIPHPLYMGKTFRKDSPFRPRYGRDFDKQQKKFEQRHPKGKWKHPQVVQEEFDELDSFKKD